MEGSVISGPVVQSNEETPINLETPTNLETLETPDSKIGNVLPAVGETSTNKGQPMNIGVIAEPGQASCPAGQGLIVSPEAKKSRGRPKKVAEGDEGPIPVAGVIKKGRGRPKKAVEDNPGGEIPTGNSPDNPPVILAQKETSSILSDRKLSSIDILAESLRKAGTSLSSSQSVVDAIGEPHQVVPGTEVGGETVIKRGRGRPRKNPNQPPTPKVTTPKDGTPKRGRGRPRKHPLEKKSPRKRTLESTGEEGTSPKKLKEVATEETEFTGYTQLGGGVRWESEEVPKKKGPGRPRKSDAAKTPQASAGDEDMPKRKPGRPKKNPSSALNGAAAEKPPQLADRTVAKKKRGRPPKNPVIVTETEERAGGEDLPVRMQASNSPSKSPARPRGRPKNVEVVPEAEEQGVSGGGMEKLQVSFSDSESEESELLGGPCGAQPPSILSALTEQQSAPPLGGGAGGVALPPTRKEPPLIDKFDESFDEDSDN